MNGGSPIFLTPRELLERQQAVAAEARVREALDQDPAERLTAVREADLAGQSREDLVADVRLARNHIRALDRQVVGLQESLVASARENRALRQRAAGGGPA